MFGYENLNIVKVCGNGQKPLNVRFFAETLYRSSLLENLCTQ